MDENSPLIPDDQTPPTSRSPVPWLVGGFLAVLTTMLIIGAALTDDSGEPEGEPPPEASFELLEGGTASFADYRGTPMVVNFLASWCAPCIRELPDFEAASQAYAGRVKFLGLSVSDRVSDTQALIEATGVSFEIGLDPTGAIHRELTELGVMPTTAFVAADGSLVSVRAGTISPADLDEHLRELLGESETAGGG